MMGTHYVGWQGAKSGNFRLTICGAWVREAEQVNEPSCPACVAELGLTADDVFGTEAPGSPVHRKPSNPTAGYSPKGAR